MGTDNIIQQVIEFADKAHGEQTRKYSSDRYIVHPIRVMNLVKEYNNDLPVLAAAILHDVLEDTPVTKTELLDFLKSIMTRADAHRTLQLVDDLTDVFIKTNFPHLKRRVRKEKESERLSKVTPDAQTIKYADIFDNTDVTRNDPDFAIVYLREAKELLDRMLNGDPELRKKAYKRVENCIDQLKVSHRDVQR